MKNARFVLTGTMAALVTLPVTTALAHEANDFDHEPILQRPIADVKNNYWYDYLSDIREADHELRKDLARATDAEDRADARKDYAKEMRERGYRVGRVTVGK